MNSIIKHCQNLDRCSIRLQTCTNKCTQTSCYHTFPFFHSLYKEVVNKVFFKSLNWHYAQLRIVLKLYPNTPC